MSYGKLVIDKYGKPTEVVRYVEEKISDLPEPKDDELILQNLASPIHPSVVYAILGRYYDHTFFYMRLILLKSYD